SAIGGFFCSISRLHTRSYRDWSSDVCSSDLNDTGTLTVTASPSFAAKWLVVRLHRFQERWPEIDVRISATDNVVDLATGDFDLRSEERRVGEACRPLLAPSPHTTYN